MRATQAAGSTTVELERVIRLLKPLEIATSPFTTRPRTNERPHWTKPSLVAQLKFTEWTDDGLLRHPIYLGMRDDVKPETVRREKKSPGVGRVAKSQVEVPTFRSAEICSLHRPARRDRARARARERCGCPTGRRCEVTNLRKVFWPKLKITKGDLMRYYVRVAPYILPVVDGRPLIMKRFPNGIDGEPFYQHKAPEKVPPGVACREGCTATAWRAARLAATSSRCST